MTFEEQLQAALEARRNENLYRKRLVVGSAQGVRVIRNEKEYLSFCSNDYLALSNEPRIINAMQNAAEQFGVGSGASHLVCGHSEEHHFLEDELAQFTGRPRALLFSSGYMANVGVISALLGRGDAVLQDKLNHASLIDGALQSGAEFLRYRHNDMQHLREKLQNCKARRKLIVVDGVFSMDGDEAQLKDICALAKAHDAWVMVDDAHGFGVHGEHGSGTVNKLGLGLDDVQIVVGTLGKAFGTYGAFVAGSETLIESLIQFARTYIYTTALPPAVAAATSASLNIVMEEEHRREQLRTLITHFRNKCAAYSIPLMPSSSPIQPIVIGDEAEALEISQRLEAKGIWLTAIRPPTVPKGTSRLRVTFSAAHSLADVNVLVEAICEAMDEIKASSKQPS
ncbi:8-amino-7-oxononanoate synthase [Thalassocella blandensis]|nr:8-amino-7-oxononanoate synthase [Thalassocella blandensis]